MGIKVLFLILLAGSVLADHTPIDYQTWHNGGQSYSKQFGGNVRNFQTGGTWTEIDNNFVAEGDSVWFVEDAVIKLRVNKNGTSVMTLQFDGQEYIVTQRLRGIAFLNMSNGNRQWFDSSMVYTGFSVDSNIFKWTDVGFGVDYQIEKTDGRVAHTISFDLTFLDSAISRFEQSGDTANIALANVVAYTLSASIDDNDSAIGFVGKRLFKQLNAEYKFEQKRERLNYPGSDTLRAIPVRQFWKIQDNTYFCFEYVKMSDVKRIHELYPESDIWHNATTTIELTNVEDSRMFGDPTLDNFGYGGSIEIRVDESVGAGAQPCVSLIRAKNLSALIPAGATMTDAICSIFVFNSREGTGDVSAYRGLKPWKEGTDDAATCTDGFSWDDGWDCAEFSDSLWGTEGCECAGDDADNNEGDGVCDASGRDRWSTAESVVSVIASGAGDNVWYGWDITNALAQGWYDGTFNEEGVLLKVTGTGVDALMRSTEYTGSEKPFFVFTYTVSAAATTYEGVTLEGVTLE